MASLKAYGALPELLGGALLGAGRAAEGVGPASVGALQLVASGRGGGRGAGGRQATGTGAHRGRLSAAAQPLTFFLAS